jgi:2,7-dihydroxy-5-methyl-1-naphthoate 7-O-methyltransferase
VLLDLPYVEADARRAVRDVSDRCEFVAGSFFDPLPDADLYLLCNVLFHWSDIDAGRVLARCAGTDVVVERLIERGDPEVAAAQDLRLLAVCEGRQRSSEEFADLARPHGLTLASVADTPSGLSVLHFAARTVP